MKAYILNKFIGSPTCAKSSRKRNFDYFFSDPISMSRRNFFNKYIYPCIYIYTYIFLGQEYSVFFIEFFLFSYRDHSCKHEKIISQTLIDDLPLSTVEKQTISWHNYIICHRKMISYFVSPLETTAVISIKLVIPFEIVLVRCCDLYDIEHIQIKQILSIRLLVNLQLEFNFKTFKS